MVNSQHKQCASPTCWPGIDAVLPILLCESQINRFRLKETDFFPSQGYNTHTHNPNPTDYLVFVSIWADSSMMHTGGLLLFTAVLFLPIPLAVMTATDVDCLMWTLFLLSTCSISVKSFCLLSENPLLMVLCPSWIYIFQLVKLLSAQRARRMWNVETSGMFACKKAYLV